MFPENHRAYDLKTNYSTQDWAAAIVGFNAGYGDILEDHAGELWEVRMKMATDGFWYIVVDSRTHNDYPDWTVDVMFVRIELVGSMDGYELEL